MVKCHVTVSIKIVGVLMWEVFTCGEMPYGRLKNSEVVEKVQKGIILEKPKGCDKDVYNVSRFFFKSLLLIVHHCFR